MKKKPIAILLAIVAGGFGAHKFYLRQAEIGISYLALFFILGRFFGIPFSAALGWYDAYQLMMMDDLEFDRKYNSYYFRDRYGRRLEKVKERAPSSGGRYIIMEGETEEKKNYTPKYFQKTVKKRQGESLIQSGINKIKDYDTKGAIEDFKKALETCPDDKSLHFNIACAYSLEEKAYEAFYHLDLATTYGFKEIEKILNHEALAYIRVLPEFEQFRNNGFKASRDLLQHLQVKPTDQKEDSMILKQNIPVILNKEIE